MESCTGIGTKRSGECDASGMDAVGGQGTEYITVDTQVLDSDDTVEPLTVTLKLVASCTQETVVTVSANQPNNVGPDDVTINCTPSTPTATPTQTPTRTPSPTPTDTLTPTVTTTPMPTDTPEPPATPTLVVETLSEIHPPNTGTGGLVR